MGLLEQISLLPYAFLWVPAGIFAMIVGGAYWWTRPGPPLAADPERSGILLQSATPKAEETKEQRNAHRRQGHPVNVLVAPTHDKTDPNTGSVLDRSMGGMRLALFAAVEIGTVLSVRPVNADEMVPWVDLEVRCCRPSVEMPGRFEVGCQYVKSPPYSIQLLFG